MRKLLQNLSIAFFLVFNIQFSYSQITLITDGAWKGVGSSALSGGNAWLFQGYDDSAWPNVEAPNAANVIPVVPGSLSIWVLPYSDTAKMRNTFVVPVADSYTGSISINADNEFELYFNAVSQGFYNNWMGGPYVFDISPGLQGCVQNVIAINAANWGGPYGASLSTTLNVNNPLNTPNALPASGITCTSFTANWDSVPTADFYMLDVSTDINFSTFYSIYHDYNVGTNLSEILSSLPPGIPYYYRLRCQRTNGLGTLISCYSNTITVDLDDPSYSYSAPDTLCAGSTITLQLNASPGSSFSWSGPNGFTSVDSISNITNSNALNSGNYIYTINYPGCPSIVDTVQIEVVDNPPLSITPSGPYCSSSSIDTLIANITSLWSGSGIINTSLGIFDPSTAGGGTHFITAISGGFCPDTTIISLLVNVDSYSAPDTLCAGETISLQLTTGVGASFNWVGPNGFTSTDSISNITNSNALNSGNYIYTINYPGCPVIIDTIQILIIDNPSLAITPAGPYCSSSPADTLVASMSSQWSGVGITNTSLGIFDPGTAGGGTHIITTISGGFCPDTATTSILVSVDFGYTISGSDTICEGEDVLINSTSGLGAVISWTGPNGFTSGINNNTITQATNSNSGAYIFTVSYTSCPVSTDTLNVVVINYPNPTITPAGPFCNDDLAQILIANPTGGSWSGNGITNPSTGNFDPALAGNGVHLITYIIPGHCPDTATTSVSVSNSVPLSSVIFPNVFTPNSDTQNDIYSPIVPSGGHFKLYIFDRWGVQVLDADLDNGWDGTIGSSIANEGIYYWICEITSDCSSEPLTEKGFLQLFKP